MGNNEKTRSTLASPAQTDKRQLKAGQKGKNSNDRKMQICPMQISSMSLSGCTIKSLMFSGTAGDTESKLGYIMLSCLWYFKTKTV